jgi:WD40 repeat protein/serine/threonine protein kinase
VANKQPTSDVVSATVSYESGVAATVDVRRGGARDRPPQDARHPAALADPSVLQGRILGDFVLGEVLGRGGCGIVYRAEQRTLGRPAVVKVIDRAPTAQGELAERFVREARLAARFSHPYAAHVYAFGVERDGLMWIAMELVDGTPLGRLLRQSGPLALEAFVPLFERLCDAVQSAHEQGIVHRDIKPSNVMVIARAGRLMPKLLDFGIAKLMPWADVAAVADVERAPTELDVAPALALGSATNDATGSLTHEGQVLGSPAYMAPEQWRDATTAGPLADQYALALLAYEALTGTHAFAGPTIEALADQHRHAPIPALPAHLPRALDAVLARASDKQPEGRFANVAELTTAIRIAARGAMSALDDTTATLPDTVVPYPGLASYTTADHGVFVGRERDVEDLLGRLETQTIVTVVGPSGSGKTSCLAAGLVPALPPRWHAELVRPGSDPLAVLAAIAAHRDAPPYREGAQPALGMAPAAIAEALVGLAEVRGVVLVVIIDQAEELFTMCREDDRRAGFAEALVLAAASPRLRVVLALRDDFLCRVEQLSAWRGLLGRAVHVLGVPRAEDLERMLTAPARRRGFGFDDPALPREIVEQVADRPGALPLVAFTAAQLWEHRDQRARQLTRAAYDRIGGVTGALVQHADSVVDRMSVPDRRQVRLAFRRLITAEGTRALISRAELESSLDGAAAAAVLDRLLAARLVVSRDDDAGDRIEIIHETLATTWPRLAAWRAQDAEGVRLQEQLAVAARHWDERGRPADLTWRGEALADLRRWQDRGDHSLTPVEHAFARTCVTTAARARRARIAIVALAFALLVAGIAGLVSANREIADQRAAAIERLSTSLEARGRSALAEGDHARALLYLAEASKLGARGPTLDLLTSHAAASLGGGLVILGHGKAGIRVLDVGPTAMVTAGSDLALVRWDRAGAQTHLADDISYTSLVGELTLALSVHGDVAAFDRSGKLRWRVEHAVGDAPATYGVAGSAAGGVAIAWGKTVALRDLDTGRARGALAHDRDVTIAALGPDGKLVATGDSAGVVRIWDAATATLVASCEPHTGIVRAIKLAPDARSVISAGNDGDVRICDAASGATRHRLIGHSHQAYALDVTRDGHLIVSGGRDGKPRLWDARTGLLIRVLEGHHGSVMSVQFSPDGGRILTLGLDGTARIWDVEGMALGSLQGHGGPLFAGQWDLDGRHVITTSMDGALRSWDPERARETTLRHAHRDAITDLAVSRDDRWVATASADGSAALWDRRSLALIVRLPHDGAKVRSIALAPDGASALTTDDAGQARIWKLPEGTPIGRLPPGTTAATFTGDGQIITAGGGAVRFWTRAGLEVGAVALDYRAEQLVLDPSGRWLFVRGPTRAVRVIDVAARAEVRRLPVGDPQVRALAVDGARVAITDDTAVHLWRLGTWTPLAEPPGNKSAVLAVWFSAGGRVVTGSLDATTLVWDPGSGRSTKLADPNRVFAAATSPDGSLLDTIGTDGEIRIWDAARNDLLLQLPGHRLPATTLRLTHDGTAVISGGNDGRLVTWDLTRRTRSTAELAAIVRCRVPLRLEGDVAVPRDLDFDDPTCKSLALDR